MGRHPWAGRALVVGVMVLATGGACNADPVRYTSGDLPAGVRAAAEMCTGPLAALLDEWSAGELRLELASEEAGRPGGEQRWSAACRWTPSSSRFEPVELELAYRPAGATRTPEEIRREATSSAPSRLVALGLTGVSSGRLESGSGLYRSKRWLAGWVVDAAGATWTVEVRYREGDLDEDWENGYDVAEHVLATVAGAT